MHTITEASVIDEYSVPLPDHDRHIGHFGKRPAGRRPRLALDSTARRPALVAAHATHARVSCWHHFVYQYLDSSLAYQ